MKHFSLAFFLFVLVAAGTVSAQDTETDVEAVVEEETVTSADLGTEDTGILPTSPFYFFKEMGRTFQRAFTFNQIGKAELEVRITGEKAAELKRVEEVSASDEEALGKAITNYERAQDRLRQRISALRENSENPRVDELLNSLSERLVIHQKLFDELKARHEAKERVAEQLEKAEEKISEAVEQAAQKDDVEKFAERYRKALEKLKDKEEIKDLRSVDILDKIARKVSGEQREKLREVREEAIARLQDTLERSIESTGELPETLRRSLDRIPGDVERHATILEEIRLRATDEVARRLESTQGEPEEEQNDDRTRHRAQEQIEDAREIASRLQKKIEEFEREMPNNVTVLVRNANDHLNVAETSFQEGTFGRALGQARSATAIARNALRAVEKFIEMGGVVPSLPSTDISPASDDLRRPQEGVLPPASSLSPGSVQERELKRVLDRIGELKPFPRDTPSPDGRRDVLCTQEYKPVCGSDGRTHSNRCVAVWQRGARVISEGPCGFPDNASDSRSEGVETLPPKRGETNVQDLSDRETDSSSENRSIDPPPNLSAPVIVERLVKADDISLSPAEIRVKKGSRLTITFAVSENNVYFGGLEFRSDKFKTGKVNRGGHATVSFIADRSFEYNSYWPSSGVLKATGKIIVE